MHPICPNPTSPVLFEPFFVSDSQLQVRLHQFRGQLRCRVSVSRDAGKVFYPKRNASSGRLVELSEEESAREHVFITLYSSEIVTIRRLEYVIIVVVVVVAVAVAIVVVVVVVVGYAR